MLSQRFVSLTVKFHPLAFKITETDTENEKISISLCFICKFVLSYKEKKIVNVKYVVMTSTSL